jgi:hypothetical protein
LKYLSADFRIEYERSDERRATTPFRGKTGRVGAPALVEARPRSNPRATEELLW